MKISIGLKLLYLSDNVDCYDVLYGNLTVSRDYELIIYRIIGVTKDLLSFGMSYIMVWIGSWKWYVKVCVKLTLGVIQLYYLDGIIYFDLKLVLSVLGVTYNFHVML